MGAFLASVVVPWREPLPPVALERGAEGTVRASLLWQDGTPVAMTAVSLFDKEGRFSVDRYLDHKGRVELPALAGQVWYWAWHEGYAGVGAEKMSAAEWPGVVTVAPRLESGSTPTMICPPPRCAGTPVVALHVLNEAGFDVAPLLSGVGPGLEFGAHRALTLGRLAKGAFTFFLQVGEATYSTTRIVTGDETVVRF